jgi:hypothetical protein
MGRVGDKGAVLRLPSASLRTSRSATGAGGAVLRLRSATGAGGAVLRLPSASLRTSRSATGAGGAQGEEILTLDP